MKVTLALPLMQGLWKEVEAELLFDLAPHLSNIATFAVHLDPDDSWLGIWNVSNVETGMWVMKRPGRTAAIRAAREYLTGKTPRDFVRAYKKAFGAFPHLRNGEA